MGQRQPLIQSSDPRRLVGALLVIAGAFCLIVHLVGVGLLAYDVFVGRIPVTVDLLVRAFFIGLIFLFGLGLGLAGQRYFGSPIFPVFAQLYLWLYVAAMAASYLATLWRLNAQNYSWSFFVKFLVIIGAEVAAITILRLLSPVRRRAWLAAPILVIALLHLLLLVNQYVFLATPASFYLIGDVFVFVCMLLVSAFLLGESLFRAWSKEEGAHA